MMELKKEIEKFGFLRYRKRYSIKIGAFTNYYYNKTSFCFAVFDILEHNKDNIDFIGTMKIKNEVERLIK